MWGWDRKIHPEDYFGITRLTYVHYSTRFSYPFLTQIMDSFSCTPLNTAFSYLKKAPISSWIYWDATYNIMMSLWRNNDGTCPTCSIFIFLTGRYVVSEIELSYMGKKAATSIWLARESALINWVRRWELGTQMSKNGSKNDEINVSFIKVRKAANIRNRYNQVPHLTQDTTWEIDKNRIKHHKWEPRGQPFPSRWPQGSNEETRKNDKHETYLTQMIHKRSIALERLLEGLNRFHGANLTLSSKLFIS